MHIQSPSNAARPRGYLDEHSRVRERLVQREQGVTDGYHHRVVAPGGDQQSVEAGQSRRQTPQPAACHSIGQRWEQGGVSQAAGRNARRTRTAAGTQAGSDDDRSTRKCQTSDRRAAHGSRDWPQRQPGTDSLTKANQIGVNN